jgi:hypothetical protein
MDRHDEVHMCFFGYAERPNNILEPIHHFFHIAELLHSAYEQWVMSTSRIAVSDTEQVSQTQETKKKSKISITDNK